MLGHRFTLLAPWWIVAACADCPTPEYAPVIGGSPQAVEQWHLSVQLLKSWMPIEKVCLREVEIVSSSEQLPMRSAIEVGGAYDNGRIQIREDQLGGGVGSLALHELCHAVDDKLGLRSFEVSLPARPDDWFVPLPEDEHAREIFAEVCRYGPETAAWISLLGDSCGVSEIGAFAKTLSEDLFYPIAPTFIGEPLVPARSWERTSQQSDVIFDGAHVWNGHYGMITFVPSTDLAFAERIDVDLIRNRDIEVQPGEVEFDDPILDAWRNQVGIGDIHAEGRYLYPGMGRIREVSYGWLPATLPFRVFLVEAEGGVWRPISGVCGFPTTIAEATVEGIWLFGQTEQGVRWWHLPGPPIPPDLVPPEPEDTGG